MRLRKWIRYPLMTVSLAISIGFGMKGISVSYVQAKETNVRQVLQKELFQEETESSSFTFTSKTYESCKEMNPDFIGWLSFPNQSISEPIVQGKNDSYYLNHWMDGSENSQGTIFLASSNRLTESRNLTLYGHHVFYQKDAKFSPLMNYESQTYYEENPTFQVWYEEEVITYGIVAVYDQDTQESFGTSLSQYTKESFQSYYEEVKKRNLIHTDLDFQYQDQLITLQTCKDVNGKIKRICLAKQIEKKQYS